MKQHAPQHPTTVAPPRGDDDASGATRSAAPAAWPIADVVIPVFNERRSLPLVLEAIPKTHVRRIVVVDNGSTDGSADVARGLGAEVILEPRKGYGSACLRGLAALRQAPPQVVVFLDGDYSDHPEELTAVVTPIADGHADFVVGSRTLGRRERGALAPQQRFGNWLASTLIRGLYGMDVSDLGPFRAIRWESLEALSMQDVDFGWTAEMQVKAARARLRYAEVPVSYRRRIGVSKITGDGSRHGARRLQDSLHGVSAPSGLSGTSYCSRSCTVSSSRISKLRLPTGVVASTSSPAEAPMKQRPIGEATEINPLARSAISGITNS